MDNAIHPRARVVQTLDSAVHYINLYPADKSGLSLKFQVAGLMMYKEAGNPATRDFVWFYFSSVFLH